ncbi:MAG: AraC family ligand binding domain-containing protein, partial [Bacteroidetes bacterium]|nr:AraC family ligand binding domain-containing protein [Bacteroidota bacterium]
MKKSENTPHRFSSISALQRVLGLPKPLNPLVALVDNTKISVGKETLPSSFVLDFYKISYKTGLSGKIKYGQHYYDFEEGGMVYTSPNQVLSVSDETEYKGYTLLIHPDFIRNYPLGRNIKNYGFFSYATHEALHLSEKERSMILQIFKNIEEELQSSIDDFSQEVIIAHLELVLNYSKRFYHRQFLTR